METPECPQNDAIKSLALVVDNMAKTHEDDERRMMLEKFLLQGIIEPVNSLSEATELADQMIEERLDELHSLEPQINRECELISEYLNNVPTQREPEDWQLHAISELTAELKSRGIIIGPEELTDFMWEEICRPA